MKIKYLNQIKLLMVYEDCFIIVVCFDPGFVIPIKEIPLFQCIRTKLTINMKIFIFQNQKILLTFDSFVYCVIPLT